MAFFARKSSQARRAFTVRQIRSLALGMEYSLMSSERSSPHPEPSGSRTWPLRRLVLRGVRPSARCAAVVSAIALTALAAGCAVSASAPAASGKSTEGLTATQGQQATSTANQGIRALGISLGSSGGAAGPGSPGAPTSSPRLVPGSLVSTDPSVAFGLNHLDGVAASGGIVYLANSGNGVVESLRNGTATVIAGEQSGFGDHGNGGPATSATLFQPMGVAADAKGGVFIADTGDNVIREITPDGIIHRIAGTGQAGSRLSPGSALDSELDHPEGLALTAGGDLLVADTYNNRILAVTPSGKIGVVAGDGIAGYRGDHGSGALAELNQPTGVAVDGQGDVYIADASNNVIRRVDAKTGIITTVAGDYAADKANDGLGAESGDGAPATSAQLNDPQGVALDSSGNLFIADTFGPTVRAVTPDGTISTMWNGLTAPYAVATDPTQPGTVYIADNSDLRTGTYTTSSTASGS